MLTYFTSHIDLWWIAIVPYFLIGSVAIPIVLISLFYGPLQIIWIYAGLVDPEMIQRDFLPQLLKKVL